MSSPNELQIELQMIIDKIEEIDERTEDLLRKKNALIQARQRVISHCNSGNLGGKKTKYLTKHAKPDLSVQNPNKYIFKSGRRLFTDAYKNYIVKLCETYNLKSIEKIARIQYNNIVRWRIEMRRGELPIDSSYEPSQEELRQEKMMKKHSNKYMSSPCRQDNSPQMDYNYYDNNKQYSSSNSGNEQTDSNHQNQKIQSQDDQIYNSEDSFIQERQKQEKMINTKKEFIPNQSSHNLVPNKQNEFERELLDQLFQTQEKITRQSLVSLAKTIRKYSKINENELKFTKEWYIDFITRNKIQIYDD